MRTRLPISLRLLSMTGLTLVTAIASADLIELDNGDRISGVIIEKTAGKLVVDTGYAGRIELDWSRVVRLATEQPLLFRLNEGQEVRGTLDTDDGGGMTIRTPEGGAQPIASLGLIVEIGAIPSDEPPAFEWRGQVNLAGKAVRGNTDTDSLSVDTRAVAEKKGMQRYTVSAGFNKEHSGGSLTKEQYLLDGRYDHFFSKRWFAYLGAGFEKDEFKDLNLRSVYSGGSGYQFFDTDELRISLQGGLSYTGEDFIEDEDNSFAGVLWNLNWEQAFFDERMNFFHRHSGNQGLDDSDNLLIKAQTGVRIPLISGMHATAEYDIDWDRSPAAGAKRTDHTYKVGVGYEW